MNKSLVFSLIDKDIAVITLSRPESRNAVNEEIIEGIEQTVQKVNSEEQIKVLIVTGSGQAFCSGGNVKDMKAKENIFAGSPNELRRNYQRHIQRIPLALNQLKVPSIAAVNGAAYGAGCDLAMMCDMRIACETAVFAESFIKLGLIPGDGGAWFLPRAIGYGRAAEMLFTGQPVSAHKAAQWGIVNKVVEGDQLMDEAIHLAKRIAQNPAQAIRMSKLLLKESEKASLESMLELSASLQALAHQTADHHEAVDAFLEKRDPNFTGD
ncbi:MAG: crotonase/enoyl-CoA hydratase family protein [Pseudomonadales bacterium]|nr:crotonase/enoyl-CoA hydratase family protein [Pseudomonadales bacterium]